MALFSSISKNKKNPPRENFSYSNIKKFLIFSPKKAVLIFQEMETLKNYFIFSQKKSFLVFRKTKPPPPPLQTPPPPPTKNKKNFLYFIKLLIFQEVTFRA